MLVVLIQAPICLGLESKCQIAEEQLKKAGIDAKCVDVKYLQRGI